MKGITKLLLTALMSIPLSTAAQTNTAVLKTGTELPVQSLKTIYARDVEVGDNVNFKLVSDIKQNGMVVLPVGTIVRGVVADARKSTIAGTKGKLNIDFKDIVLDNGERIPLSGNVRVSGKNRTPLAVITACFVWPCIFIPGTKAVMHEGFNATATVLTNTEIVVK